MAARYLESPLIVIVGPTASGKTSLAVSLAQKWGGEVISADSRAIYRGMDVGAAKPTMEERSGVPHWGFDLVDPGQRFTVADFKQYALKKIEEIRARGGVPLLVGGTGLYVDSVLFDYQFAVDTTECRLKFEGLTREVLQDYCIKNNIQLPKDTQNKRRLIRAIERQGVSSQMRSAPISTSIIVGIATDRNDLRTRIALRAEQILQNGVVDEATLLGGKYGWDTEAMSGNVYPLIKQYVDGALEDHIIVDKLTTLDWQLAKRQMTWLRKNPYVYWGNVGEIQLHIERSLSARSMVK